MKGLDIFIIRFLPFILFIIFIHNIISACYHNEEVYFYHIHCNSAIYATSLFLISLANKRYHCVWNRAMYLFLIVIPITNYLGARFNLFPTNEAHILFVVIATILTALTTAYLAIKHFVTISKRKLNNGSNQ